jgi:hypothetical protein
VAQAETRRRNAVGWGVYMRLITKRREEVFNTRFSPAEIREFYSYHLPGHKWTDKKEQRNTCPIHGGDNPTAFTFNSVTGQSFCHTGCGEGGDIIAVQMKVTCKPFPEAYRDVCRIVGRDTGSSMYDASGTVAHRASGVKPVKQEPSRATRTVASYEYLDENQTERYRVDRKEDPNPPADGKKRDKLFVQSRPNPEGDGRLFSMVGVERLPYRLPEMLAQPDACLVIVEGEKCVEALRNAGYVATCNSGGSASAKDFYEYAERYFAGRNAVIIPDNDKPGLKWAATVIDALLPHAKGIWASDPLPGGGINDGWDVADYLAAGNTDVALSEVLQRAPLVDAAKLQTLRERGHLNEDLDKEAKTTPQAASVSSLNLIVSARSGEPKPLLANVVEVLTHEQDINLAYDEFHQRIDILGESPWGSSGPWRDDDSSQACIYVQRKYGIYVQTGIVFEAANTVARKSPFHPVRRYLEQLQWDGTLRLGQGAARYFGAEDTEYTRAVFQRWMISAVARIFEPGCKADCMLILEGPQGLLKSTALRILAGVWYTDDIAEVGTKDAALQIIGVWIVEFSELDAHAKATTTSAAIKAYTSRSKDRFRPPYGRVTIESPRQCVFAGTVNPGGAGYLRDETGGRRFWPITCGSIRVDELKKDRDQLWAEAVHLYQSKSPWWLETPELCRIAEEQQSERYQGEAWDDVIKAWLSTLDRDSVSVPEVLSQCILKDRAQWTPSDSARVGRTLTALKWERKRMGPRDAREWRYRRPEGWK